MLLAEEYKVLLKEAGFAGIQGGTIYDAIHLKCADLARVDRLYTLNLRHFQSIAPTEFGPHIMAP